MRPAGAAETGALLVQDHLNLRYLVVLLQLGEAAHSMISSQKFRLPQADPQILRIFLPALAQYMVDIQIHALDEAHPVPATLPASVVSLSGDVALARRVRAVHGQTAGGWAVCFARRPRIGR